MLPAGAVGSAKGLNGNPTALPRENKNQLKILVRVNVKTKIKYKRYFIH